DKSDAEYTIEQGKLWMLQTRVGKRTGVAALKMAVDMTKGRKWHITHDEAVQRVNAEHLDQVLHPQFKDKDLKVLAKGLAASPGAAVGKAYFTADGCVDAVDRGERANADNGPDAANARKFGAEGIGLCRTEHMFLGDDRLPIVRRMILADTPETEEAALEELRVAQRADFIEILEAMDGLPVTVRLL